MAAAAILQKRKIAISPQSFDRSPRNLARLCSWILLTVPTVKISKIKKSKMAADAILKNGKIPYLSNSLTDWHKIWQGDAF